MTNFPVDLLGNRRGEPLQIVCRIYVASSTREGAVKKASNRLSGDTSPLDTPIFGFQIINPATHEPLHISYR
jgi:hypothetical protein